MLCALCVDCACSMHGQNIVKNYRMRLKRVVWTFILLCTCVLGVPICMHDHMPDMQACPLKGSCLKASLTIKRISVAGSYT